MGGRLAAAGRRVADAALALAALVLLAPLGLAAAAAVSVTPGPVLMRRHCVGRRWREFTLLTFRTRVYDKGAVEGPGHHGLRALPPPRLTPAGRFLARWRVDRLPALVNVLRGEMALFGPLPVTVAQFRTLARDEQRRRYAVAPGCFAAGPRRAASTTARRGPAVGF